jgi:hypothetical protein
VEAPQRCGCNTLLLVVSPYVVWNRTQGVDSMMGSGITGFPAELQVIVFAAMGSGARIADWVSALNISKEMRGAVETAFGDWVAGQPLGTSFGAFIDSVAEVQFVMDHVQGRCCTGFTE